MVDLGPVKIIIRDIYHGASIADKLLPFHAQFNEIMRKLTNLTHLAHPCSINIGIIE